MTPEPFGLLRKNRRRDETRFQRRAHGGVAKWEAPMFRIRVVRRMHQLRALSPAVIVLVAALWLAAPA
jgi:hypothetical protein